MPDRKAETHPRKSSIKKRLASEERRQQILDAARHLFATMGFDKTTIDDIARRVGISRPRIIQLFGSKENIYKMIAQEAYKAHPLDKDLAEPISRRDDFGVFKEFALHILTHTSKPRDREIFKILMYARLREDSFHKTHFQEKDKLMISRLLDYVRERIAEGAFRDMDHRSVVYAYQAMISNLAIYKNVLKQMDFVEIEQLADTCAQIFLNGLLVNP